MDLWSKGYQDNNIKTQVHFGVKHLAENRLGIALPLDDRISYTIKMIKTRLREEFGGLFCPLYKLWLVSANHYDKIVEMVRKESEFNKNPYSISLLASMYDLDNNAKIYIAKKIDVQQQKFTWYKSTWTVRTEDKNKLYSFVYDKRLLNDDLSTTPYGF